MADLDNLPRFELFQRLVWWLSSSTYGYRKERHYLETNHALLGCATDKELTRLIEAEDKLDVKQQMHRHRFLLQDARQRGGTREAICEAYVNMYGGLTLDVPTWLEEIEQQRLFLRGLGRPERTRRGDVSLLQTAFALAASAPDLAAETIAELHNELGLALLQGAYQQSQEARLEALQKAIASHEAALFTYTLDVYPLQYAKTQMCLGSAYQQSALSGQANEADQAIACYLEALQVYTPDAYAEQWLHVQTLLGAAYLQRVAGDPCDNREQAIAYQRIALQQALTLAVPHLWATIQTNLGDAYRQRIIGVHAHNLEQAMICYRAALQIFTPQRYPVEWAGLHTRLASLFQEMGVENEEKRDKNLRCAIVCYEGALQVYTPDSFLVEHAATLINLANVYRKRQQEFRSNLEQAARYYQTALQVFTSAAFPAEHRQTLFSLTEVEGQRLELLQTGLVRQQQAPIEYYDWNNSFMVNYYNQ